MATNILHPPVTQEEFEEYATEALAWKNIVDEARKRLHHRKQMTRSVNKTTGGRTDNELVFDSIEDAFVFEGLLDEIFSYEKSLSQVATRMINADVPVRFWIRANIRVEVKPDTFETRPYRVKLETGSGPNQPRVHLEKE